MPSFQSLSKAFVSALLFTTSWAGPIEKRLLHTVEHIQTEPRRPKPRQHAPFAVTGGVAGNGSRVQPRLEIRDLAANADQFNIFLLGMQKMQAVDQSDFLSYFQLAGILYCPLCFDTRLANPILGIHGRPMVSWNGVQGNDSSPNPGYCTHVSNLFLAWHRPYLALYEVLAPNIGTPRVYD
jgi:tyrosinase